MDNLRPVQLLSYFEEYLMHKLYQHLLTLMDTSLLYLETGSSGSTQMNSQVVKQNDVVYR